MPRKPAAPKPRTRPRSTAKPKAESREEKVAKVLFQRNNEHLGPFFEGLTSDKKSGLPKSAPKNAQAVIDSLRRHSFGCQRNEVISLASAIIGFDIAPFVNEETEEHFLDDSSTAPSLMLVPTVCDNDHDYPIGDVCMFLDGPNSDPFCGMLRIDGETGNTMDSDLTCCRLPTYEEVLRFVNVNLRRIDSFLVIV
jgi:hypothetical protein